VKSRLKKIKKNSQTNLILKGEIKKSMNKKVRVKFSELVESMTQTHDIEITS
jgi:hypothetical protein